MTNPKPAELPVRLFEDAGAWEAWLAKQHAKSAGLWLRIAKAASNVTSVSYAEALDVALCYGWIDGQKKPFDDATWLQKFTPRGKRSIWSKINREKVQRLVESGRMQSPGLQAVDRANRYAILFRIQTVKRAETRAKKIEQFIGMLERHEVIHS
jgi:uncharacterized protein YdeI (YjbR/CyaY-like superfamily)